MDKDGKIEKFDKVLIKQPADATGHFRDPQIFDYKGQFYAIVGAQNHDKQGYIKLYKAVDNDVENWVEVGNLDFGGTGSEYMIECPNLVFVDGKPVLLYSPQGLDKAELDYGNIYPNTYKIFQDSTQKNLPSLMAHQLSTWTTDLKHMQLKALILQMVVPLLSAGSVFQMWTIQLTNTTTKGL